MNGDPLEGLEELLRRRQELWGLSIYYWGASERSPSYGPDDQAAWDKVTEEIRETERMISALAQRLRTLEPARFADWVADRRRQHELRLASPDVKEWEVDSLRATIARWERFLCEDYSDFYCWMSW